MARGEEPSLRPGVVSASAPRASAAPSTGVSAPAPASVRRLPRNAASSVGAAAGGADTLWDSPEAPAQQARTAADGDGVSGPADGAMRRGADSSASGVAAGSDHHNSEREAADMSAASIGADPSQWLLGPSSGSAQQHSAVPLHRHHDHDGEHGGPAAGSASSQDQAAIGLQRQDDVAMALERLRRAAAAARAPLSDFGAPSAVVAAPSLVFAAQPSSQQQPQQPSSSAASAQPHLLPMLSSLATGSESAADASVRAANEAIMSLAAVLQRV